MINLNNEDLQYYHVLILKISLRIFYKKSQNWINLFSSNWNFVKESKIQISCIIKYKYNLLNFLFKFQRIDGKIFLSCSLIRSIWNLNDEVSPQIVSELMSSNPTGVERQTYKWECK